MKLLTCFFSVIVCFSLGNLAIANSTYPFVCKGPLRKATTKTYEDGMGAFQFEFIKHTSAGGTTGAVLPQGTCAWTDRAVAPSESNIFYFDYNSRASDVMAAQMVLDCLSKPNCSIAVNAFSNSLVNNAIYTNTRYSEVTRTQN